MDIEVLVNELEEIADILRLKSSTNPFMDDIEEAAERIQIIINEMSEEL